MSKQIIKVDGISHNRIWHLNTSLTPELMLFSILGLNPDSTNFVILGRLLNMFAFIS